MATTTAPTPTKRYTHNNLATHADVSVGMVGRVMRGDTTVRPEIRAAVIAAVIAHGGTMTDVPISAVDTIADDEDLANWPAPKLGDRSSRQKRIEASAREQRRRAKNVVIARAAHGDLTVDDLEDWCRRYVGGRYRWGGKLIKLWFPEFEWQLAHLQAWIDDQVPEQYRSDAPRLYRIPECGGCGAEFMGTSSTKDLCPACDIASASADDEPRTWTNTCRTCADDGVDDPTFEAGYDRSAAPWNLRYCIDHERAL